MQSDLLSVVYVYKTDARLRIEIEFADPPPLKDLTFAFVVQISK